ncbi:MAG: ArsA family ATPase [Eubacteriales bacterium]|nr:ArsA family ATPase [Eubacteriales bacterium]
MRILIYTGKGGVGKTSIAAATAVKIANEGKRVIIMSTDQAHSLRDAFGTGGSIPVKGQLDLLEINTVEESKKAWGSLQDYLKQIISEKAQGGLEAEEALIFPGFEELFSLLRILEIYESNEYDVAIIDCAPTGETLSLLRYPERLSVVADKILPMVRNVNKAFGSLISRKTSVPKPKDLVFAEFDKLVKQLNQLRIILQNRDVTSLRIVMSPERIVIDEARRSYTWIQIYDFAVDAVYVNRIYPKNVLTGYFEGWANMQEESLKIVEESFPQQKIFYLPMQENEIHGLAALENIGDCLYGLADSSKGSEDLQHNYSPEDLESYEHRDSTSGSPVNSVTDFCVDPATIFCKEQAFRMEDQDGTRILTVNLPYAKKEELTVRKDEKELVLTFRNERRRFRLPDKLVRRYISSWEYEDGALKIYLDYE